MPNLSDTHNYIVYMKAGPYCGFTLPEIINIKYLEERTCGKFYWGYGGVFCHPKRVYQYIDLAIKNNKKVFLMFSLTKSKFTSQLGKANEYSTDKENWELLPKEVLLVGNQYAFVANNLSEVDYEIDMGHYRSMLGQQIGKSLSEYIRYRIDKACAIYDSKSTSRSKIIKISYISELVPPYCIYVR